MPKSPGLPKVMLLIVVLPMIPKALKLMLGEPYNVRDAFDWAFMISAGLVGVIVLGVAVWCIAKKPRPATRDSAKPFNYRVFGIICLPIALLEFSVVTGTLSATDGVDPSGGGSLSWVTNVIWVVALTAFGGIGVWSWSVERSGRDLLR